jgi:hypothetical protein
MNTGRTNPDDHSQAEPSELTQYPKFVPTKLETTNWENLSPDQRAAFLLEANSEFTERINELATSANLCVERYKEFSSKHRWWKSALILLSGIVAILNLLATTKASAEWTYHPFPLLAAVAAVLLTIVANFDSFYNFGERAQVYREARELFVDARRQLAIDWDSSVRPLGDLPEACRNADEMYRRCIAIDRELRARFRKLTTIPEH